MCGTTCRQGTKLDDLLKRTQAPQKGVVGQRAGGQEQEFIDPSGKYQLKYKVNRRQYDCHQTGLHAKHQANKSKSLHIDVQGAFAAVEVAVRPNDGLKAEAGQLQSCSAQSRHMTRLMHDQGSTPPANEVRCIAIQATASI